MLDKTIFVNYIMCKDNNQPTKGNAKMNRWLDKDALKTARVSAMYSVVADSKRFVAQSEIELERELDNLIAKGKNVNPADVERVGKQIAAMNKPVSSDTYVRICKKYIKISNSTFAEYKRIKDIVAYDEKYGSR